MGIFTWLGRAADAYENFINDNMESGGAFAYWEEKGSLRAGIGEAFDEVDDVAKEVMPDMPEWMQVTYRGTFAATRLFCQGFVGGTADFGWDAAGVVATSIDHAVSGEVDQAVESLVTGAGGLAGDLVVGVGDSVVYVADNTYDMVTNGFEGKTLDESVDQVVDTLGTALMIFFTVKGVKGSLPKGGGPKFQVEPAVVAVGDGVAVGVPSIRTTFPTPEPGLVAMASSKEPPDDFNPNDHFSNPETEVIRPDQLFDRPPRTSYRPRGPKASEYEPAPVAKPTRVKGPTRVPEPSPPAEQGPLYCDGPENGGMWKVSDFPPKARALWEKNRAASEAKPSKASQPPPKPEPEHPYDDPLQHCQDISREEVAAFQKMMAERQPPKPPKALQRKPKPAPADTPGEMTELFGAERAREIRAKYDKKSRPKRIAIATVGATVAAGAVAAYFIWGPGRKPNLVNPFNLHEDTLRGIDEYIENLEKSLRTLKTNSKHEFTNKLVTDGKKVEQARLYAEFIKLRDKAEQKGKSIKASDLVDLLNNNGISDLKVRLGFLKLARNYFVRVEEIKKTLRGICEEVDGKCVVRSDKLMEYIEDHFGFTPSGRVEVIIHDVNIAIIFHDQDDYVKAVSPKHSLWSTDRAKWTEHDQKQYELLRQFALRTAGMSFGKGMTIIRNFGEAENEKIDAHEKGHEDDSIHPSFEDYRSPWAMLEDRAEDPNQEKGKIRGFLALVFFRNGIRSMHTEYIQYLREHQRLINNNPLELGSPLYDPRENLGLDAYFALQYADNPELLAYAQAQLREMHRQFYTHVNQAYEVLKRIANHFESNPEADNENKPYLLAYMAIQGTQSWDLELMEEIALASVESSD